MDSSIKGSGILEVLITEKSSTMGVERARKNKQDIPLIVLEITTTAILNPSLFTDKLEVKMLILNTSLPDPKKNKMTIDPITANTSGANISPV